MEEYWAKILADRKRRTPRKPPKAKAAPPPQKKRRKRHRPKWRAKNGRVNYALYMQSRAWESKRKAAFSHHGTACQICASEATHVHHLSYKRLGNEPMDDLQVLCDGCHKNIHEGDKHGNMDPMTAAFLALKL